MTLVTILFIGHIRAKDHPLLPTLERRYQLLTAQSGKQGVDAVHRQPVSAIILDAVSLNTNGERICRMLKAELADIPIIHIHPGPKDQAQSAADVVLFPNVTPRRLTNSIGRLLHKDEEVIVCGPFKMNVARRILIAHGEEIQLTPKAALLVEVFLRNPGKTLDRKFLMEQVWETDYLGDTRTLDVHIRWIRKVMENGGSRPRYLKTIRGVGYQFAIPEEERVVI